MLLLLATTMCSCKIEKLIFCWGILMQKNEGTLLHFGREKGLSPGSRLSRNHGELAWRTVRVLSCCERILNFQKRTFSLHPLRFACRSHLRRDRGRRALNKAELPKSTTNDNGPTLTCLSTETITAETSSRS